MFIQTFRFKKVTRYHEGTNEKSANIVFSLIIIIRLYISSFLCFNQRQLIAFQWLLNLILLTLDLLILLSDRQIVILQRLGPLRTQLPLQLLQLILQQAIGLLQRVQLERMHVTRGAPLAQPVYLVLQQLVLLLQRLLLDLQRIEVELILLHQLVQVIDLVLEVGVLHLEPLHIRVIVALEHLRLIFRQLKCAI